MLGKSVELARGRGHQAPPPPHVWKALANPASDEIRGWVWFRPEDDEQFPEIARAVEPSEVVWRYLWPERSDLRIEFEIEPRRYTLNGSTRLGSDSTVTWVLRGPDGSLTADDLERRSRRLRRVVRQDLGALWSP